jgi:hypothetical protein
MALATVADALAQYNANVDWHSSRSSADLALQAIRFLLVNRAQRQEDVGSTLNYESLEQEKVALEQFLGATSSRAFGRRRRVGVSFRPSGIQ